MSGIYSPGLIGNPVLASITAHEIFHAWNVKRLRPADMWPYRYDRMRADAVALGERGDHRLLRRPRAGARRHRSDPTRSCASPRARSAPSPTAPPTALEDASLSTWIHPTDGSGYLYYPKGSLAGLMLDIMIRDASDNHRSLDTVMRELYRSAYKQGRGFTAADWWGAVSRAAGGKSFTEFAAKYVDGREPYPWDGPAARRHANRQRHRSRAAARHLRGTGLERGHRDPGRPAGRRRGGGRSQDR